MTDWYERTIKALQLNGKGERTQQLYARAVRMLSEFYEKTPDLVSEEELQEYFLHRKNVNKWAPNTMRICYYGIRFFFEHVLKRDWHILTRLSRFFQFNFFLKIDIYKNIKMLYISGLFPPKHNLLKI